MTIRYSPRMQRLITRIVESHGQSIDDKDLHLKLALPSYMPLTIERTYEKEISIAHYYEQNGDLIADPDVSFLMLPGGWAACEIRQVFGAVIAAELSDGGIKYNKRRQADIASFCVTWAANLRAQGWEKAKRAA